ncbi:GNAT family N-acetyltransferase [Sneathiella glossodoripedis]|uniref:GNAT family N-acetyltransferase n=1 Tax=Sneathiella glossodoripedis TaxID=418853 RepID=UPI0011DDD808|nr:GNAT family N-acetyltransferase [Sneathiella glossodoripedis]
MIIRKATIEDADWLAKLINLAGSGMPLTRWRQLAINGADPWQVGQELICATQGEFSFLNCAVASDEKGQIVAMRNSFVMTEEAAQGDTISWPAFADPIQELEEKCMGDYYINFIATRENRQGKGYASHLLKDAEECAATAGIERLSLIVLQSKEYVVGYYEKWGYRIADRRHAVPMGDAFEGDSWLLMHKHLQKPEKD